MNTMTTQVREPTVTLPEGAPLVRITAGAGSAGQKTWNLRRPVTLIGSRRPAHIVLHDKNISPAHCVIVNTGTCVLIKDLHTSGGTTLNASLVDFTVLSDGDVITVGNMNIQVAIQVPENASADSAVGLEYQNPTQFIKPVFVKLADTKKEWKIEDAVVMIGRHESAYIHLDHADVSTRHAVLFRFKSYPAVFDLGSRKGLRVNDQPCSITSLYNKDRMNVGPFNLAVSSPNSPEAPQNAGPRLSTVLPDHEFQQRMSNLTKSRSSLSSAQSSEETAAATGVTKTEPREGDSRVADLHADITETWERLNSWQSQLEKNATALNKQESNLAARATELEEKDAEIRGQLHDITRLQEEVLEAEQKVEKEKKQLQTDREAVAAVQKQWARQDVDIKRHLAELQQREQALAQRWSHLQNTTCSHCGKRVHTGSSDEQNVNQPQVQS